MEETVQEAIRLALIDIQKGDGLSDGQMAAKLGCSRQLWQKVRTGESPMRYTLLWGAEQAYPHLFTTGKGDGFFSLVKDFFRSIFGGG